MPPLEEGTTAGDHRATPPLGQPAILPDPGETGGEHLPQKAPETLDGVEGHRPLAVALRVILPPASHPPLVAREPAMMRDRHTMRVAGQIGEDLRRATKRRFGLDDPVEVLQGRQELRPRLGSRQRLPVAWERQAALRLALAEPGQQEAPEHPTEHAHWQEAGGAARQPLGALWSPPAAGDHTVQLGMRMQGVAPGMQDRAEAQVGAEMPRSAGDRAEGIGHGLKPARRERARVLQHDRAEGRREREDHMAGGDVEECRCTGGQPRRLGAPLALGAMPVATGVRGHLGVGTVVALPLVASEGRRPAGRDGPQGRRRKVPP